MLEIESRQGRRPGPPRARTRRHDSPRRSRAPEHTRRAAAHPHAVDGRTRPRAASACCVDGPTGRCFQDPRSLRCGQIEDRAWTWGRDRPPLSRERAPVPDGCAAGVDASVTARARPEMFASGCASTRLVVISDSSLISPDCSSLPHDQTSSLFIGYLAASGRISLYQDEMRRARPGARLPLRATQSSWDAISSRAPAECRFGGLLVCSRGASVRRLAGRMRLLSAAFSPDKRARGVLFPRRYHSLVALVLSAVCSCGSARITREQRGGAAVLGSVLDLPTSKGPRILKHRPVAHQPAPEAREAACVRRPRAGARPLGACVSGALDRRGLVVPPCAGARRSRSSTLPASISSISTPSRALRVRSGGGEGASASHLVNRRTPPLLRMGQPVGRHNYQSSRLAIPRTRHPQMQRADSGGEDLPKKRLGESC